MTHITLAHGNGGRYMRELIDEVFARHLHNPVLNVQADAVALPLQQTDHDVMLTTDSFTVKPLVEMASLGSKVLQIRSVEFASKYNVPIRVLSSFEEGQGTLITSEEQVMEHQCFQS